MKTNCVGCHTNIGNVTIVDNGSTRTPIVYNTVAPTYPPTGPSNTNTLAGGNFYWVAQPGGERYGHNVFGISGADGTLATAPGNTVAGACVDCHATLATAGSGCQGCHVPHHHAIGEGVVAGMDEGWYRFLGSVELLRTSVEQIPPVAAGVTGISDPDWEQQSPSSTQHNTYEGATEAETYSSEMNTGSISQKCAGCHSNFHDGMASGGVWIRHPNDVVIPNSGEFTAYTTYNPLVPVARPGVVAGDVDFANIVRGSDVVSCISCHRAHGSPYPAMLRWGYRDWPGTDSHTGGAAYNGCAVCHSSKD